MARTRNPGAVLSAATDRSASMVSLRGPIGHDDDGDVSFGHARCIL